MIKTIVFIFLSLGYFQSSKCQNLIGLGVFGGAPNSGIKMELHTLRHLRIETALELNRYSLFSGRIGGKLSPFNGIESINNIWICADFGYTFGDNVTIEKDEIFYTYSINELSYFSSGLSYSRMIKAKSNGSTNKFILFDFNLNYRFLLNSLQVIPDAGNIQYSSEVESRTENFFSNRIGGYVGLTFFFGH